VNENRERATRSMAHVLIYCTAACPYCQAAERLLEGKGVGDIERVRVDLEPARRAEMQQKSGRTTVPQIWIDGRHIGGSDELHELEDSGKLDQLLAKAI
jgi:glutaredoxin 3